MAEIWNRYIRLQVGSALITNDNLDIEFSIKARTSADSNSFEISIWNLSRATRDALKTDQDVLLTTGYGQGQDRGAIFSGTVKRVADEIDGIDVKTVITALTQQFATKVTIPTYKKGTAIGTIVREMFRLSDIPEGKIDDQGIKMDSDATPTGATAKEILEWCKNVVNGSAKKKVEYFVEGGEGFFVPEDYVRPVTDQINLSSDTGLIETTPEDPDNAAYTRSIKCFLQWRVRINSLVQLTSIMPSASGLYSVVEYTHTCDQNEFTTEMKVKPA